jgi:hypothetical protein
VPNISDATSHAIDKVDGQNELLSIVRPLDTSDAGIDSKGLTEALRSLNNDVSKELSETEGGRRVNKGVRALEEGTQDSQEFHEAMRKSYGQVRILLKKFLEPTSDKDIEEKVLGCGLVRAVCQEDGSHAWVDQRWRPLFEHHGQMLLNQRYNLQELERRAGARPTKATNKGEGFGKDFGPFELVALSPAAIGFTKKHGSQKYTVTFTNDLAKLGESRWASQVSSMEGPEETSSRKASGWLTKWAEITLALHVRTAAGIPKKAAYFAWAFPLLGITADASKLLLEKKLPSAMHFVVNGGFVYSDKNYQPIQVCDVRENTRVRQSP